MSREKQIEEMARVIDEVQYLGGLEQKVAQLLFERGYRKQSEGEWIVSGMFDDFFKCSSCGDIHPWQTAIEYKFCPNCGAKMKGGAG